MMNYKRSTRKWPNASNASGGFFDVDNKLKELEGLDKAVAAPDFWNNNDSSRSIAPKVLVAALGRGPFWGTA